MKEPPKVIWLQFWGDEEPMTDPPDYGYDIEPGDVTWCVDQIFPSDIKYVIANDQS